MPWVLKANIKGPIGSTGDEGPQGLPGVNAVANDTATAGYITTPGASATKTALEKRFGTEFHIKNYGALGDEATNDTAAIAATYAAGRAFSSKPTIVWDPGIYRVSAPYAAFDPGGTVTLGYGATVKPVNGVMGFNIFQTDRAFEMRGLKLDLNKANTTNPNTTTSGAGIYVYSTSTFGHVVIEDMEIVNGWQAGIALSTQASGVTNARNVPATSARVRGVTFRNTRFGTFMQNVSDVSIENCWAYDTAADSFWDFMSLRSSVTNCRAVRSGGHGIVTQYSDGFTASGNQVFDPNNHGIVAGGGDSPSLAPAVNFVIANNTVRSATVHGITVDTTRAAALTTVVTTNGVVTGNVVEGSGVHGIYLQNAQGGVCSSNVMLNNVNSAIALNSGDWVVDDNYMVDNGTAIAHQGSDAAHGNNKVGPGNARVRNVDAFVSTAAFARTSMEFTWIGSPEGQVAAPVGSRCINTAGGASTMLYLKTSGGVTSSGWTAK